MGKTKIQKAQEAVKEESSFTAHTDTDKAKPFFEVRFAQQWIDIGRSLPPQKRLIGELIVEGDVTIIFAQENVGKTTFGYTIAEGIAKGETNILGEIGSEMGITSTLYIDCEMNTRQYLRRMSNSEHTTFHHAPPHLYRVQLNCEALNESMTKAMFNGIAEAVDIYAIKVVILDNLSWLQTSLESAAEAANLMQKLRTLTLKKNITTIVFAHTPKIEAFKPITSNDLAGSSQLKNLCDALIGLGKCRNGKIYLKQLKTRFDSTKYGADNCIVLRVANIDNMLKTVFDSYMSEKNLLLTEEEIREIELAEKVHQLKEEGVNQRDIATKLGISQSMVCRILKR